MKNEKMQNQNFKKKILLLFLLIGIFCNLVSAVNINSCGNLNVTGATYDMTASIINNTLSSALNCLTITTSNVTLNCNGYYISSTNNATLVYTNQFNSTIKNCNLTFGRGTIADNNGVGIKFDTSALRGTAFNNSVSTNNGIGIYVLNAGSIRVLNNTAYSNLSNAISVISSSNNILIGNNASSISNRALFFSTNANNNTLISNVGISTSSNGIYFITSSNNFLTSNTGISSASAGIHIQTGSGYVLTSNIAVSNTNYGLYARQVTNTTIINQNATAYSTNGFGLVLDISTNDTIIRDCVQISGFTNDTWVTGNSGNNTFINCSYNSVKEKVDSGSQMIRKWYYRVNVTDDTGSFVNAVINATNVTNGLVFSVNSNLSGLTGFLEIIDYININGIRNYYSPYVISAENSSYVTSPLSHSFNASLGNNYSDNFLFQSAPSFIFNSQIPSDINSVNTFANPLKISYFINNISEALNLSSIKIYFKTNNSFDDTSYYTNGTATAGFQNKDYSTFNPSNIYNFSISDNQIYPAVYNFPEISMEGTPHLIYNLGGAGGIIKTRFFNFSNSSQYNQLEFMANTSNLNPMTIYYCNSSGQLGGVQITSDTSCVLVVTDLAGTSFNHTHSVYSTHWLFPLAINITSGKIGSVKVTSTSYFCMRGTSTAWDIYYITNISRANTIQTSANTGTTYSNFSGTTDMHIHQYNGNDTFYYFVSACGISGLCVNSTLRSDLIDLVGLPPTQPIVFSPSANFYHGLISIEYTSSISMNDYSLTFYNISLLNLDNSFNKTIIGNNGLNLNYSWNTTGTNEDYYRIKVQICDNLSQCSSGLSDIFLIDNTPPFVSVYTPPNNTLTNQNQINFTINVSDNTNISTINLSIYNASGSLINETIINPNIEHGLFSIMYNFIADGIYSWYFTIIDVAGNFFRTIENFLTINSGVPQVAITFPLAEDYSYTIVTMNYTLDGFYSICQYSLDKGITNISIICGEQISGINSISGNNTWRVSATNIFGNETIAEVNFTQNCINPNAVLSMPTYPYVSVNETFTLTLSPFVAGNSNIQINLTDMADGSNYSYSFVYNSSTQKYYLSLLFTNATDINFVIYGDNICPTISSNIAGVLFVRNSFIYRVCGFNDGSGTAYKNNFGYVTAEFSNGKIDMNIEPFIYPISFIKAPVFYAQYIDGCADLTLYEPDREYVTRLIDGQIDFAETYSVANISKSYGTNALIEKVYLNGSDTSRNVLFTQTDLHPYRTLFNWIYIGIIILTIILSVFFLFAMPEHPSFALIFSAIIILGSTAGRIIIWLYFGW
jgi:parallel beta-helix repeat protein